MKNAKKYSVEFIGESSIGVTQSCYKIRFQQHCVLLDVGGYQEGDILTNYQKNCELIKQIKPKEVEYIILHEIHSDHTMLVPALYSKSCQAHIYVPKGSIPFLRIMWEDSAKIMESDILKINHKHGLDASPLYSQDDIERALNRCIEVEPFTKYYFMENAWFEYYPSNHIKHACQIHIEFKDGYNYHKLNFTGDIGGELKQAYCSKRVNLPQADLCICENTYNSPSRPNNPKDRDKDMEKICSILNDYYYVIIPAFALHRSAVILSDLYKLWKSNKISQDTTIYFDSPLGARINNIWEQDIEDEQERQLWHELWYEWDNLIKVNDFTESQFYQKQHKPCIIVSSAGMLNAGRILHWLKEYIPDKKTHILFIGYCPEKGLPYDIKHCNMGDLVEINGDMIPCNCNYTELRSYSSHACYDELKRYILSMRANKIVLVHGEQSNKVIFAKMLQEEFVKQGLSTRVIASNKNTRIFF